MAVDPRDYEYEHSRGGMSRQAYEDDPKRLCFTLARYKHVSKMLAGAKSVLEVGCGDGFGTRIVRQHVEALTAIDSDPRSIEEAKMASSKRWPIEFFDMEFRPDLIKLPCNFGPFSAAYSLDVLEHINPDYDFLWTMSQVAPISVIGTPSRESQQYASRLSRLGHVNCYSAEDLHARLREFWDHVFLFTMHDEQLGTSYYPMAQYLLALCVRAD